MDGEVFARVRGFEFTTDEIVAPAWGGGDRNEALHHINSKTWMRRNAAVPKHNREGSAAKKEISMPPSAERWRLKLHLPERPGGGE